MEPLAEENKKLREAMNLSEKNIQRAQRERDLAESNTRDLEYQKGNLFERLATASEQLWSKSEQLATIFEQLTVLPSSWSSCGKSLSRRKVCHIGECALYC